MAQLEHIEAIEKRLWNAADTLRANSNYASNEYFLPVMGLIFLRHAYSRFLGVKDAIKANLPKRGGKRRALTKEDFSQKSAIFLQPKAQFDYLVALTDSDDRAKTIIEAMEPIEGNYNNLRGVLPKSEYQELDNSVLGQLLRTLNPDELKRVSGDVFGRIYEYFLTQFADQKAHDRGEFFTPVSLVSLIANVLEPEVGTVLDPACGSGGMFVQSARFVERQADADHGAAIVKQLTADLRREFPVVSGYSRSNVFYMREFYLAYRDLPKVQPLVAQIGWTHNLVVLQRCKEPLEREFYILMTKKFGWFKNVLIHHIENQSNETGLPVDAYDEDEVNIKTEEVFVHVFRAYPTMPSPYYESLAVV